MQPQNLGRLKKIPVRQIWLNEAQDFSPWLAREENFQLLGEVLGLELELEAQEKNVGPFRADLLFRETLEGSFVLVENQLERTDHTHLGQLLTYAAGLKTVTIVWIAVQFTEEHRATLDWLNDITGEQFRFFGLELELWKIGDSEAAPKFNIVSKPNNWSRAMRDASQQLGLQNLNESQQKKLQFWTEFKVYVEQNSDLRPQSPRVQRHMNFSLGNSACHLSATFLAKDKTAAVGIYIKGSSSKALYELLQQDRKEIEQTIGSELIWRENPTTAGISIEKTDFDYSDKTQWQNCFQWMLDQLCIWDKFFRIKVNELDLGQYEISDD